MNTILHSTLALALLSSASLANDNSWASLDQEIAHLSSSLTAQEASSGPKVSGWLTTTLRMQDEGAAGGADEFGFGFEKVRLEVSGKVSNDYSYKVTWDFWSPNQGSADLKDAFIKWKPTEGVDLQMGRFKNPVLRSMLVVDNRLLFVKRTLIGQAFDDRFIGIMGTTRVADMLQVQVAAQNSGADHTDEMKFTVRGEFDVLGKAPNMAEGAYGAADSNNLAVAAFYQEDTQADFGTSTGVEATLTMGPFYVSGEIVMLDEGVDNGDIFGGSSKLEADTTPWDVTGAWMISDNWELAGRYEDLDAANGLTQVTGAVTYYVDGHDMKWGFLYIIQDADDLSQDEDELALYATIAF